ncbi:MAG: HEPN domain-containing protein [Ignavibacteriales bacterium]|nr:MAG: HEPN domain-containing protein [Ignavibacteriales bacterium]
MENTEHIKYWLDSAIHDLDAAESLFKNKKYDWCLFIGHLVLEKTLKAIYVLKNPETMPPKVHNLVRISEYCGLDLTEEQRYFFDEINDFNIEARYPSYKFDFYQLCTKEFTEKYFELIKETHKWLLSQLK